VLFSSVIVQFSAAKHEMLALLTALKASATIGA
jgi:hypothetical protein